MTSEKIVRIGGASGFWGESDMAVPQLLKSAREDAPLDYIVFDYLAEITMSIMARARAKDPSLGYATDFVSAVVKPHIKAIADANIKLIANAGGTNPLACAEAVRAIIAEAGLDLKVAVVLGDDLTDRAAEFAGATEMFSGVPFPDPDQIASINAYLGAVPIAQALGEGADIVITGRCVDSAVTLGACLHEFGWAHDDWDRLAGASLAGHLLECGPQATGGNFTDWADVPDIAHIGYPIAEIASDGSCTITKPSGTGGMVSVGTVGEQMLYEIGDPQAYMLPDVICDFADVEIEQAGANRVAVRGAKGRPAPDTYKASATWADGWRMIAAFYFTAAQAGRAARVFADNALVRAREKLRGMNAPDFDEVLVEVHGDGSTFGEPDPDAREVALKIGVKHRDPRACGLLLKEAVGLGLATPAGLSLFGGSRPKPSPVVRLFSLTAPKESISIQIDSGNQRQDVTLPAPPANASDFVRSDPPARPESDEARVEVPLVSLAFGRSGDKGDKANIGILPRDPAYAPWLWAALTEDAVRGHFAHFLARPDDPASIERWYLPGTGAINFLLHDVLGGGGVASLRNDPQGKAYAQISLSHSIPVPQSLAKGLS